MCDMYDVCDMYLCLMICVISSSHNVIDERYRTLVEVAEKVCSCDYIAALNLPPLQTLITGVRSGGVICDV